MTSDPTQLLLALGRTTIALAAAGLATAGILRLARANWPAAHRLGWLLTLLIGWTFLRLPVAVPWYEAARDDASSASPATLVELAPVEIAPVEFAPLELAPLDAPENGSVLAVETPVESPSELSIATSAPIESLSVALPSGEIALTLPATDESWSNRVSRAIFGLWLLGMAALVALWSIGYLWFVRTLRTREPAGETWQAEWRELLSAQHVARPIRLCVTPGLGPLLCRLPRGYELLVPEGLWRELDASQRRAILRHELAHYRRGDVWKSLAVRLLALPHWFNPVAWWAARRFDDAAEIACDRAAVADEAPAAYARALVRLGELPGSFGYGAAARGRTLAARVRRLLAPAGSNDSTIKKSCLVLVGLAVVAMSVVQLDLVAKQPVKKGADPEKPAVAGNAAASEQESSPGKAGGSESDDASPAARMVAQAKRAYEAHMAAYEAETVTMPTVYEWSRRWMEAAKSVNTDPAVRLAAVQGHLERMQSLHKRIAKLYEIGVRGGEAKDFAATSFYVAEAEQWLAIARAATAQPRAAQATQPDDQAPTSELRIKVAGLEEQFEQTSAALKAVSEARNRRNSRSEQTRLEADYNALEAKLEGIKQQLALSHSRLKLAGATPQLNLRTLDDARSTERGQRGTEMEAIDLKIKIADLEGQSQQAEIQLKAAKAVADEAKKAYADKIGTRTQAQRADADLEKLMSQVHSFKKQLELYNQKLEFATAMGETARITVDFASPAATKADAVFAGKSFDAWAGELRNDLSPARRGEAIHALASFGANGYGRQAAAAILDAAQRYRIFSTEGYEETRSALNQPALDAFFKLPVADTWPLLIEALKSSKTNRRLAAASLIINVPDKRDEILALLTGTLADPDVQVRRNAINYLVQAAPETPGLSEQIREGLESDDKTAVQWAEGWVRMLAGRVTGDDPLASPAAKTLLAIGPKAIPAVEKAVNPDQVLSFVPQINDQLRHNAAAVIAALRGQEQPKPEEQK